MADCGCSKNQKKGSDFKLKLAGQDQDPAPAPEPAAQKNQEDQEFTIAGFKWWTVLLVLGMIYTVFNWDHEKA